jgi:hypothetical protein
MFDVEPPHLRHRVRAPVTEAATVRAATVGLPYSAEDAGPSPGFHQPFIEGALVDVGAVIEHRGHLGWPRADRHPRFTVGQIKARDRMKLRAILAERFQNPRERDLAVVDDHHVDVRMLAEELRVLVGRVRPAGDDAAVRVLRLDEPRDPALDLPVPRIATQAEYIDLGAPIGLQERSRIAALVDRIQPLVDIDRDSAPLVVGLQRGPHVGQIGHVIDCVGLADQHSLAMLARHIKLPFRPPRREAVRQCRSYRRSSEISHRSPTHRPPSSRSSLRC